MHKDFFVLDCTFGLALLFGLRIIPKTQSNTTRKTNLIIHHKNCNRIQMEARVKYFTYLCSIHFIQHHNGGAVVVEH